MHWGLLNQLFLISVGVNTGPVECLVISLYHFLQRPFQSTSLTLQKDGHIANLNFCEKEVKYKLDQNDSREEKAGATGTFLSPNLKKKNLWEELWLGSHIHL